MMQQLYVPTDHVADLLIRLQAALAGRYAVERELGRGAMAIVFVARDLRHDRVVALKVLRPELAAAVGSERFLREIHLAARLQHPHILPLHDSGKADGSLYYVMPYVEGESLRDRLERGGPLSVDEALRIAREIAEALSHAHSRDVVHRDIKPENILLSGGHAVVADFGIARAVTAAGGGRLTETGIALGTPAYMSPEQASAEPRIDGRSDIYALGCVLYEMLVGQPPFTGPNAQAVLARHTLDPVPPLRTVRQGVPPTVEHVVLKALAKVPADRFATAAGFAEALGAAATATAAPQARASRRKFAIAATLVVLSVLGWVAAKTPRSNTGELRSVAVLPCENLTRDPAQEYLTDQWTQELIDKLYRVAELRPKSWLSVQRYKATTKSPREIAREVGAGTLVRCRVAEVSARVQLDVEVIRADKDQVIWSKGYEQSLGAQGINLVQSEAARDIARALGSVTSPLEGARVENPLTYDLEALRMYRLGRHFSSLLTVDALQKAIDYYQRAIARDSGFAAAYVALASDRWTSGDAELRPAREYLPEVMQLLLRALEIDQTIAEAHSQLGSYFLLYSYDWQSAQREHQRAIRLSPNSSQERVWHGVDLAIVGYYDEAIAELERAVQLDPAYPIARVHLVQGLRLARRYTQALNEVRTALEIDSDNPALHFQLGLIRLSQGETDSALASLERGDSLYGGWAAARAWLGYAYGVAGQREKAGQVLSQLLKRSKEQRIEPTGVALVHAGLGNHDEALRWLQEAYEQRSVHLPWYLGPEFAFDPLRDDPRFRGLRNRVGVYSSGRANP